jgi:hypothetical protein
MAVLARESTSSSGDRLRLARQLARALLVIAADAATSRTGRALPLSPRGLTRPTTFERLLQEGGSGADALPLRPDTIVPTALESPSSNCQNTIFDVAWRDAAADVSDPPKRLFVKQPCADLPTRVFANVIGFWKIECAFCRNLAREVPIAMPRIHAVAATRRLGFPSWLDKLLDGVEQSE